MKKYTIEEIKKEFDEKFRQLFTVEQYYEAVEKFILDTRRADFAAIRERIEGDKMIEMIEDILDNAHHNGELKWDWQKIGDVAREVTKAFSSLLPVENNTTPKS